jgi:hypothetical protein
VSAHRVHPFVGELAADNTRPPRKGLLVLGLVATVVAISFAIAFVLTVPLAPTKTTPIVRAAGVDAPLPPASANTALHARLDEWRAGYEAAVENGCQIKPLLSAPVATR